MKRKGRGAGRDGILPQLRPLLAVAWRLQHAGDRLDYAKVTKFFGGNYNKAYQTLHSLMGVGDVNTPSYLPLSEDNNGVELVSEPDYRCHRLRLTRLETTALVAALDRAGLSPDNPSRERILACFGNPSGMGAASGSIARPDCPENISVLTTCAIGIVDKRDLVFAYQGTKDAAPRRRRVMPKRLHQNGELWKLDAYDYEADGERTFYLAHMNTVQLVSAPEEQAVEIDDAHSDRRVVTLRFSDKHLLDLFEWPGLKVVRERAGVVEATIPYYGGPWLVRRIASGGGSITTTDEALAEQVRTYAQELLEKQ